jgi:hypothetical protein
VEEALTILDSQSVTSSPASKTVAAKSGIRKTSAIQPLLFKSRGNYYVKADRAAIPVSDASCFVKAAEFLLMCFFVFWVEYRFELRLFYVFLEQLMGLKNTMKSSIVSDFNC